MNLDDNGYLKVNRPTEYAYITISWEKSDDWFEGEFEINITVTEALPAPEDPVHENPQDKASEGIKVTINKDHILLYSVRIVDNASPSGIKARIVDLNDYKRVDDEIASSTTSGDNTTYEFDYQELLKAAGVTERTDTGLTLKDNEELHLSVIAQHAVTGETSNPLTITSDSNGSITSAIESVVVDSANAPVEFFNLQGVRVDNPANGIFIRRQGNTVSKVVIR